MSPWPGGADLLGVGGTAMEVPMAVSSWWYV
jgi:hypothetical protein